jgi:hypothetical protein
MKIETLAAALLVCAAAPCGARAQVVEDVIHSFTGGADGANPAPTLLVDSGGGTGKVRAVYGSSSYDGAFGQGTAFQLVPPHGGTKVWTDTPLWTFTGGVDGDEPFGNLIAQTRHVSGTTPIYGTTSGYGGGNGTVFSLTGTSLTTLYTFTGGDDGAYPFWGVVADKSGALYTAPSYGGANGCGTVIQLVPPAQGQTAWTENTIYSFTGGADGCNPNNVVIDAKGNLFGTSAYGGNAGNGTAFELIPPGNGQTDWTEQTIWGFQGGTDGASSYAPPTLGKGGVVYGTTAYGGNSNGGTVFALSPPAHGGTNWSEQIIAAFSSNGTNNVPYAPVIIDKAGALYGTTSGNFDGSAAGAVFRVVPPATGQTTWTLETLFAFLGGKTGSVPYAGLTADSRGVLYGTTYQGGLNNDGVVFSLTGTGYVP